MADETLTDALPEDDAETFEELKTAVRLMFTHTSPAVRASAAEYAKSLVLDEEG